MNFHSFLQLLFPIFCVVANVSSEIQYRNRSITGAGGSRAAIVGLNWPKNVIPYTWHKDIDKGRKRLIIDAMRDIMKVVPNCWKFVKRTRQKHWVQYQDTEDVCNSAMGNTVEYGETPQITNFGGEACNPGGMVHELYHTVGITHEHQRNDRDYYVDILWENIPNNEGSQWNYILDSEMGYETNIFGLPYNFKSIMQYAFWNGDAIDDQMPLMSNKRNKSALNWDIADEDVGQAFFLTRQDIQLLALRGNCKVPDTESYNITNALPTDKQVSGKHHHHRQGLELKLKMKLNK